MQSQTIRSGVNNVLETRLGLFLENNRIRRSPSREAVFRLLLENRDHIRLSDLIRSAKRAGVGEATVYRALQIFQRAGLVSRLHRKSGEVFYEIAKEHHDHMICNNCGLILEFHSEIIEKKQRQIAKTHGFVIHQHRHEILGLCRNCSITNKGAV